MNSMLLAVAAAALAFTGAAPVAAKVNVIQSASPALARGSSFAWAPQPAVGFGLPNPTIANEITADRLRVLTEVTLSNKGYRQVADPAEADLLIRYIVVMLPETDARLTADRTCAVPLCAGGADYSFDTTTYTQGTLVLDMIERRSGRLVWRATSEKRVTDKDVTQEKLARLLKGMTKSLPAQ